MSPISLALVAAQIGLLVMLASPVITLLPQGLADIPGALCLASCAVLACWAFLSMRGGNFTVLPEPRDNAHLVTRGPYASIRHPMYTAVLLGGLGVALTHNTLTDWVLCLLLLGVMLLKIRREEGLLIARYADYPAYRARTAALLPGLY